MLVRVLGRLVRVSQLAPQRRVRVWKPEPADIECWCGKAGASFITRTPEKGSGLETRTSRYRRLVWEGWCEFHNSHPRGGFGFGNPNQQVEGFGFANQQILVELVKMRTK